MLSCIFNHRAAIAGTCSSHSGWPDRSNFCLLGDFFFCAVFLQQEPNFALFFPQKTLIGRKCVGLHSMLFFHNLIWSPWSQGSTYQYLQVLVILSPNVGTPTCCHRSLKSSFPFLRSLFNGSISVNFLYMYICMYVCMYVHRSICGYVWMYLCLYVCL
jgi:hypothetical protein